MIDLFISVLVHKLLDDILSQWDNYHSELKVVSQTLSFTEKCLQRYHTIGFVDYMSEVGTRPSDSGIGEDIAALKIQVDGLENLMADMEIIVHVSRFKKFFNIVTKLPQVCETPTRQEIKKTQSDIQNRWQHVYGELQTRRCKFRECLQQWLAFEEEYKLTSKLLDSKEELCNKLLDDTEQRPSDDKLANCKALQQDLDPVESHLKNLFSSCVNVTKNMDPSSIVKITSKLSNMNTRVLSLRQKLGKHIKQKRFQDAFDNVKKFVSMAQIIHRKEDSNKSADENMHADRLENLKKLAAEFKDNSAQLDSLNDMRYRLALNETSAAELNVLNHLWHDLYAETKERCKTLQGILPVQQDFTSMCDTWMTFLEQTKSDLSTEIADNPIDLLPQQQSCEDFKNELQDKEKSKNNLKGQCRALMKVSNEVMSSDIEQKIALLEEKWEHIKTVIGTRQSKLQVTLMEIQLDVSISNLCKRLADIENGLSAPVINKECDGNETQHELQIQDTLQQDLDPFESLLRNLFRCCDHFAKNMDPSSIINITSKLSDLEQRVLILIQKLGKHILQGDMSKQKSFQDAFEIVKKFVSNAHIIHGKKDSNKSADEKMLADRLEHLKKLAAEFKDKSVQLDSLNDLGYRLALNETSATELKKLNHRWNDLYAKTKERCKTLGVLLVLQDLTSKCDTWITFLAQTESDASTKIAGNRKALLTQQQKCKDFKNELQDKEKSKNNLIGQCQALMKFSNEVRSSDLVQKIALLEEKWGNLKTVIGTRQSKLQKTLIDVHLDVSNKQTVINKECDRKEIEYKLQTQDVEFNRLHTAMNNLERLWRNICQMAPVLRSSLTEPHDKDKSHFRHGYLMRVLRLALPLQLLLLLLLAIACLVPMSEEDYSCRLANNFRRPLELTLQYTDGPPPV